MSVAQIPPSIVATIYIHKLSKLPDINAGPILLAGFMEAPVMGPPNIASKPIVAPIAIPAKDFIAFP